MIERIKQIIKEKGLQSSSFADTIGVSRGTISHILNGRMINGVRVYNDPSKDSIDKILNTFRDISSTWFIRGEGPMYNHQKIFVQPDLFGEKNPVELPEETQAHEYAQKNEVEKPLNNINSTVIQDINISNNISKKIDKIIIYFSDKTFMTFIPEE